eukprot:1189834-Rhodomonas_salina.1
MLRAEDLCCPLRCDPARARASVSKDDVQNRKHTHVSKNGVQNTPMEHRCAATRHRRVPKVDIQHGKHTRRKSTFQNAKAHACRQSQTRVQNTPHAHYARAATSARDRNGRDK